MPHEQACFLVTPQFLLDLALFLQLLPVLFVGLGGLPTLLLPLIQLVMPIQQSLALHLQSTERAYAYAYVMHVYF